MSTAPINNENVPATTSGATETTENTITASTQQQRQEQEHQYTLERLKRTLDDRTMISFIQTKQGVIYLVGVDKFYRASIQSMEKVLNYVQPTHVVIDSHYDEETKQLLDAYSQPELERLAEMSYSKFFMQEVLKKYGSSLKDLKSLWVSYVLGVDSLASTRGTGLLPYEANKIAMRLGQFFNSQIVYSDRPTKLSYARMAMSGFTIPDVIYLAFQYIHQRPIDWRRLAAVRTVFINERSKIIAHSILSTVLGGGGTGSGVYTQQDQQQQQQQRTVVAVVSNLIFDDVVKSFGEQYKKAKREGLAATDEDLKELYEVKDIALYRNAMSLVGVIGMVFSLFYLFKYLKCLMYTRQSKRWVKGEAIVITDFNPKDEKQQRWWSRWATPKKSSSLDDVVMKYKDFCYKYPSDKEMPFTGTAITFSGKCLCGDSLNAILQPILSKPSRVTVRADGGKKPVIAAERVSSSSTEGPKPITFEKASDLLRNMLTTAKRVPVYYDPKVPSRSVLFRDVPVTKYLNRCRTRALISAGVAVCSFGVAMASKWVPYYGNPNKNWTPAPPSAFAPAQPQGAQKQ